MSVRRVSPSRTRPAAKARSLWGIAACVVGIGCAALGVLFLHIVLEFAGIFLGAVGYALGARRLGFVTIVLATALLLVFLVITQGMIPGVDPSDPLAM